MVCSQYEFCIYKQIHPTTHQQIATKNVKLSLIDYRNSSVFSYKCWIFQLNILGQIERLIRMYCNKCATICEPALEWKIIQCPSMSFQMETRFSLAICFSPVGEKFCNISTCCLAPVFITLHQFASTKKGKCVSSVGWSSFCFSFCIWCVTNRTIMIEEDSWSAPRYANHTYIWRQIT